jgi:acyl-coenzyme A synthetase/AMP-(fatty) acid ligase
MKVRGFQVAPAELEGHLLLHPDVADVCVVGIPDEYSGEIPLAFVVLGSNALKRLKEGEKNANDMKKSISKVCELPFYYNKTNVHQYPLACF